MTFAQNQRNWLLHSPLRYPGSKLFLYHLLSKIVKEDVFIDAYAGSAVLALNFARAGKNVVINDIDKGIYSFWVAVRSGSIKLARRIERCEISIENYHKQLDRFRENNGDIIDLGFATFYINRTNFSGMMGAKVIGGESQNGKYGMSTRFNQKNLARRVRQAGQILTRVDASILIQDALTLVDFPGFLYCDPPYLSIDRRIYRHNYDESDMQKLLAALREREEPWALSHVPHPLIDEALQGFYSTEISHRYGIKTFEAHVNKEKLWSNVPLPKQHKLEIA